MSDFSMPSLVHVDAMASVCQGTLAGWLWYCDVHDAHGNADSQVEAQLVAQAHVDFYSADEPCDIVIWLRTPHERVDTHT